MESLPVQAVDKVEMAKVTILKTATMKLRETFVLFHCNDNLICEQSMNKEMEM